MTYLPRYDRFYMTMHPYVYGCIVLLPADSKQTQSLENFRPDEQGEERSLADQVLQRCKAQGLGRETGAVAPPVGRAARDRQPVAAPAS